MQSQEEIRAMWMDSMKSANLTQTRITYEDFLLLMKGQPIEPTPETDLSLPLVSTPKRGLALGSVPEGAQIDASPVEPRVEFAIIEEEEEEEALQGISTLSNGDDSPSLEANHEEDGSVHSLPNMGGSAFESSNSSVGLPSTSPESPADYRIISNVPVTERTALPDLTRSNLSMLTRRRSKSLASENEKYTVDEEANGLTKNKNGLTVNLQLYHAHRQMRLSVLEASQKFEEDQARRARDTLIARKLGQAGLVMRHGHKVQVTSEAIRKYLKENKAEQQVLVEKANKRGGRGRRNRKKTVSDLNAMLSPSYGQDEMVEIAKRATYTPTLSRSVRAALEAGTLEADTLEVPDLKSKSFEEGTSMDENQVIAEVPSLELIDKAIRKATVPGEFRETADPFGVNGLYGAAQRKSTDVKASIQSEDDTNIHCC